jgi:cobalt-zinc-cadmium efflux system protein
MSHSHDHTHGHGESGDLRLAFLLNLGFAIFEVVGGLLTNSIAILSDALHDLGDSISLGLAWYLGRYSQKGHDERYSYGYRRFSLLGALINSAILVGGSLFVLTEAVERLQAPEPFEASGMIAIALIGIVINGIAVLRLKGSQQLNTQVIGWHLLEDVLGWSAVLIVGVVSLFVDAPILDPILSILITIYILGHALDNLRKSLALFLQAVPPEINIAAVEQKLRRIDGVQSTHHTHIWSLDGEHNVLTTHLVVRPDVDREGMIRIKRETRTAVEDLHLEHLTVELEYGDEDCSQEAARYHE